MTITRRRTVRGAAAGLGALAIIAGTAACGVLPGLGDEDGGGQAEDQPTTVEESEAPPEDAGAEDTDSEGDAAEDAGSEDADSEDAPEGEDSDEDTAGTEDSGQDEAAAAPPLAEEDLAAAGDRFYDFLQAIANEEPETACGLVLDVETGEPAAGEGKETCIASFDEAFGGEFDPSMMQEIQREMLDAVDNGDGTAEITALGDGMDMYMEKASDGQWYVKADSAF